MFHELTYRSQVTTIETDEHSFKNIRIITTKYLVTMFLNVSFFILFLDKATKGKSIFYYVYINVCEKSTILSKYYKHL